MVALLAKALKTANAAGVNSGLVVLATIETLLDLIEDGLLHASNPSALRTTVRALRSEGLRKIQSSVDLSVQDVVGKQVKNDQVRARTEAIVAQAARRVTEQNQARALNSSWQSSKTRTTSVGSAKDSRTSDELTRAVQRLVAAVEAIDGLGGRITVRSELPKRRGVRAARVEPDTTKQKPARPR